jgi:hypothetical protein
MLLYHFHSKAFPFIYKSRLYDTGPVIIFIPKSSCTYCIFFLECLTITLLSWQTHLPLRFQLKNYCLFEPFPRKVLLCGVSLTPLLKLLYDCMILYRMFTLYQAVFFSPLKYCLHCMCKEFN